jgi:Fur family transcriptional regulator, ferric uptake regulator
VTTGKVIEFNSDKLRRLRDEICKEHGFEPMSHQFHIFGLSPEAQSGEPAGANVEAGPASTGQ